jgi:hypothetical protein
MQRTESKSLQVHPADEQYMINVMQEFFWNLKSSQEIKISNQKITGTSSTYNSFTQQVNTKVHTRNETEHYIKLVFERPYEFANRERLVQLENEFFSLRYPPKEKMTMPVVVGLIGLFLFLAKIMLGGFIVFAMGVWIYTIITGNKKKDALYAYNNRRKQEIIAEATPLSLN